MSLGAVPIITRPDPAKCQLTLSSPATIVAQGGAGSVLVTASPECEWTVSTQASWITDVSPTSGQGNGSFAFRAAENPTASRRESDLAVNDNRVRVAQEPSPRMFDLSPVSDSVSASEADRAISVDVLSGCTWMATSSDAWITITSNPSGSGDGTVSYAANDNAAGRSGSISIGGRTFAIMQDGQAGPASPPGVTCSYTLGASHHHQTLPAPTR